MRIMALNVLRPNDIIVACDSFKGSLGSAAVNEACREGILAACPHCNVTTLTLADGGEGTALRRVCPAVVGIRLMPAILLVNR